MMLSKEFMLSNTAKKKDGDKQQAKRRNKKLGAGLQISKSRLWVNRKK